MLVRRANLHLGEFQRVIVTLPGSPLHDGLVMLLAVLVATVQVGSVAVGVSTAPIPPGTFAVIGTRAYIIIVVLVFRAEPCSIISQ